MNGHRTNPRIPSTSAAVALPLVVGPLCAQRPSGV